MTATSMFSAIFPDRAGANGVIDQVNLPIPASTPKGPVDINCHFTFPSFLMPVYGKGNTVTITVQ